MKRPGLLVRLMGAPPVATVLLVVWVGVGVAWSRGNLPGWLAFVALLAALRTLSAVRKMRRYKTWAAEWQAMGEPFSKPPQAQKKHGRGWVRVTGAALLVLTIPALAAQIHYNDGLVTALAALWCAAGLYLVFALVRGIVRRGRSRRKDKAEVAKVAAEAAPVAWLVGRAAFSPSRADAVRQLPEYCSRLIGAGGTMGKALD